MKRKTRIPVSFWSSCKRTDEKVRYGLNLGKQAHAIPQHWPCIDIDLSHYGGPVTRFYMTSTFRTTCPEIRETKRDTGLVLTDLVKRYHLLEHWQDRKPPKGMLEYCGAQRFRLRLLPWKSVV